MLMDSLFELRIEWGSLVCLNQKIAKFSVALGLGCSKVKTKTCFRLGGATVVRLLVRLDDVRVRNWKGHRLPVA